MTPAGLSADKYVSVAIVGQQRCVIAFPAIGVVQKRLQVAQQFAERDLLQRSPLLIPYQQEELIR